LSQGVEFPLANTTDDNARSITGTAHNVVARWLDPLTQDTSPEAPHYGANNDYIAYFGDGWKDDWKNGDQVTRHPQFSGDGKSGWIWTNHEYISNYPPTTTSAPIGQHLTLAKYLKKVGVLTNDVTSNTWSQADVDTYIQWFKKQIGGTWMRVYQDKETGEWKLDTTADNKRYDSTDNTTLSRITGFDLTEPDHDDKANTLPDGVAVGIAGDCSGGQSPWGTIFTAEENVQDFYGDLEAAWTSNHKFLTGKGFDPDVTPSESGLYGRSSDSNQRHNRDLYGFPVEIDPGQDSDLYYQSVAENKGDGQGHRKHGSMGRARWENVAFATEHSFYLVGGKPIVMYGGNDRRSGRIYKWVSKGNFQYGMIRAETRALLDEGDLYVAHFTGLDNRTGFSQYDADDTDCDPTGSEAEIREKCPIATEDKPALGEWIWLSVDNQDQIASNAEALGKPDTTVGDALKDVDWNKIGGFPTDNDVKSALFTAAMKIGVMELNRPEDVEWNPKYPGGAVIHVAFTKSGRQTCLDQDGVLYDPAVHDDEAPKRIDSVGSIFTLREADAANPGSFEKNNRFFKYWLTWLGTKGTGPHDAATPDNLMIDAEGGLWFGTDGNFKLNGTADAVYYLDLDPDHKDSPVPTYGLPFRVAAGPSDAEATGPAFNATQTTLFFNVQHPGENLSDQAPGSTWPRGLVRRLGMPPGDAAILAANTKKIEGYVAFAPSPLLGRMSCRKSPSPAGRGVGMRGIDGFSFDTVSNCRQDAGALSFVQLAIVAKFQVVKFASPHLVIPAGIAGTQVPGMANRGG